MSTVRKENCQTNKAQEEASDSGENEDYCKARGIRFETETQEISVAWYYNIHREFKSLRKW